MRLARWRNRKSGNGSRELAPRSMAPLQQLRTQMDRMFDRFFQDPVDWMDWPSQMGEWLPSVDVTETANEVVVRAEVPGIDPKDIDVRISGNTLTLSGEKQESQEREDENYFHCERSFGSFRRMVTLPTAVDVDKVDAGSRPSV